MMTCDVCRLSMTDTTDHAPCEARAAAMAKAVAAFGRGAIVGYGRLLQNGAPDAFYVGRTCKGRFEYVGVGVSWDEAFRNVRRVLFHLPRERLVLEELPPKPKASAPVPGVTGCWKCGDPVKPDDQGAYLCKCGVRYAPPVHGDAP